MPDPLRKVLKDWLEIVAILAAASWALWTFYFSEVLKPKETRGFLQLVLDMAPAGDPQQIEGATYLPIRIGLRATNPTKRKLEVSSGYLEVHAERLTKADDDSFTPAKLTKDLEKEKAARSRFVGPAAAGSRIYLSTFFQGWIFDDGEVQQLSRLLWVPVGCVHQLELNAYVLSGPAPSEIAVRHAVGADGNIDYVVRPAGAASQAEHQRTSNEGRLLINKHGLVDSTAYLAIAGPARADSTKCMPPATNTKATQPK